MFTGAPVNRLVQAQLVAFHENFGVTEISRAHALHITPYQLLIVASMVEREARVPGDRAKIAAVIYNRLREGMPLGVDATLYYAIELRAGVATYTSELTEAQLHQLAVQHPHAYRSAAHAHLQPRAWLRFTPPRTRRTFPTSTTCLRPTAAASTCSHVTAAEFEVHEAAYREALSKNNGHAPACSRK